MSLKTNIEGRYRKCFSRQDPASLSPSRRAQRRQLEANLENSQKLLCSDHTSNWTFWSRTIVCLLQPEQLTCWEHQPHTETRWWQFHAVGVHASLICGSCNEHLNILLTVWLIKDTSAAKTMTQYDSAFVHGTIELLFMSQTLIRYNSSLNGIWLILYLQTQLCIFQGTGKLLWLNKHLNVFTFY